MVTVHGQLAPLPWACGEAECHNGKSVQWSKIIHIIVAKKERREAERKRRQTFKGIPPLTNFLQTGPPLPSLPSPPRNIIKL